MRKYFVCTYGRRVKRYNLYACEREYGAGISIWERNGK